ncbi:tetratricopeptide repeat protein [Alienimonas sp. DA493]|uniref:tetratricopeptide repeat protein n=1 Tax=Alienimonas sp. DA493 TaxID=3373605 RepID=UPI00375401E5
MRDRSAPPAPFLVVLWAACGLAAVPAAAVAAPPPPAMLDYLETKATAAPGDATAQRLFGRALLDAGRPGDAAGRLRAAVELDPLSGAARFDLGRALHALGDDAGAAEQWRETVRIAPDSEYAADAQARLAELPPAALAVQPIPDVPADEAAGDGVTPAGYEIREFPGPPGPAPLADDAIADGFFPSLLPDDLPMYLRLETGLLYDSNVALAPTSRQLAPGDRESFQFFFGGDAEYAFAKGDGWATGVSTASRFTLNEDEFEALNLRSFTPGLYSEWALPWNGGTLVPRLEYRFTLDQFDGETFSQRHGVVGRLTHLRADGVATVGYLALDHADFEADGILPEVTSADGVTYAGGVAREWLVGMEHLSTVRLAVDLDRLDATGSDYAYYGAGLSGRAVMPIVPSLDLTLSGGVGFRTYDRFEFEPSRDELILRGGAELRKWFSPRLSVAAVANYQQFDSENPLFASDRFVAGVITEWVY